MWASDEERMLTMGSVIALDFSAARGRQTAMGSAEGLLVGTVQPSRDRIMAALEHCTSLRPLHAACTSVGPELCVRRERIIASLLERLPNLPREADEVRISLLCTCPYAEVYRMESEHVDRDAERQLHLTLMPAWDTLAGEERYFAQRCAVALVDALYGRQNKIKLTA